MQSNEIKQQGMVAKYTLVNSQCQILKLYFLKKKNLYYELGGIGW